MSYHHAGASGERMYSCYSFFTSALGGNEWSASRPGRAYPQEWAPGTHCTGGWVGLVAELRVFDNRALKSVLRAKTKLQGNGDNFILVTRISRHRTVSLTE
jgi:hypothetical protein